MTTVSSIITQAYRETNLIESGKSPTSVEIDEALTRLQVIISSVMGFEAGENLLPLSLDLNCYDYIPSNSRIMLSQAAAETVSLDPSPSDGARLGVVDVAGNLATYPLTIDGNGRTIEDATDIVLNTNGLSREWFYRADLGDWVRVTALTVDSEMPFPQEFDDMFILLLAMRLNPRHGQQLQAESVAMLRRSQSQFRSRYHQKTGVYSELGLLRLSSNQRRFYRYSEESFNSGRFL